MTGPTPGSASSCSTVAVFKSTIPGVPAGAPGTPPLTGCPGAGGKPTSTCSPSDSFRARFAREVSAARKVGGLFTAQVVDADLDSPLPWLVTAYVPGASLAEAVEKQGPLPATTVLALVAILVASINIFGGFAVTRRMLGMFTR